MFKKKLKKEELTLKIMKTLLALLLLIPSLSWGNWSCTVESVYSPSREVIASNFMMNFEKINENEYSRIIRITDSNEFSESIWNVVHEDEFVLILNDLKFRENEPKKSGGYSFFYIKKDIANITGYSVSTSGSWENKMQFEFDGRCIPTG